MNFVFFKKRQAACCRTDMIMEEEYVIYCYRI